MTEVPTDDDEGPLERALSAVVSVHSHIPSDALTADVLGVERLGSGVIIQSTGIVVTIGYLVTEAERVWLTLADGRVVAGDVAGIDQASGLALVRVLDRDHHTAVQIGSARDVRLGARVIAASGDGTQVKARIVAKQEFAGYWEYRLDEAIFTAPAHNHWGGAALFSPTGRLVGIGSLHIPGATVAGRSTDLNMFVPIDLLKGVQQDLLTYGRTRAPARPWLGIYVHQEDDHLTIGGVVRRGPSASAGVRRGDRVLAVARKDVKTLAEFYETVWKLGSAGVEVPITLSRDGQMMEIRVRSGDRRAYLKRPTLH
jgi:S1-C subfamily serine protease